MPTRETDAVGEVMMPVKAADAMHGVELTLLRTMGDNLAAQTTALLKLTDKVDEIKERLIVLEAQKATKLVEKVEADLRAALAGSQADVRIALSRIDALEAERDRNRGAESVWTWLSKNAAWLFAGAAAFIAGLALKGGFIK